MHRVLQEGTDRTEPKSKWCLDLWGGERSAKCASLFFMERSCRQKCAWRLNNWGICSDLTSPPTASDSEGWKPAWLVGRCIGTSGLRVHCALYYKCMQQWLPGCSGVDCWLCLYTRGMWPLWTGFWWDMGAKCYREQQWTEQERT
eukprot:4912853-Amphidinium_carterae.1